MSQPQCPETNRVRGPYCKVTDGVFFTSLWKKNVGDLIELQSTPRSQGVRASEYGPLNQPISAHLVPERCSKKLSYIHCKSMHQQLLGSVATRLRKLKSCRQQLITWPFQLKPHIPKELAKACKFTSRKRRVYSI